MTARLAGKTIEMSIASSHLTGPWLSCWFWSGVSSGHGTIVNTFPAAIVSTFEATLLIMRKALCPFG
jgi:hypothetical protein